MKKLFENWRNHLDERGNPSERRFREAVVDFVVGHMKVMGMNPGEPADRARIQKDTHGIVDLAIEQLGLAQEGASLNEGTVPHSAHHVVKKMMKTGKSAKETLKSLTTNLSDEEAERWLERHKDEMDSAKRSSMKEDMGREILIPGYGSLTVRQARRKLARLIMAAAEDAQKDPPVFRYLDDGVIQAIHQALKDNKEQ